MRVLVAEHTETGAAGLAGLMQSWGYEVVAAADGAGAIAALAADNPPKLALLDCVLPGLSGLDVCRTVRSWKGNEPPYLILLTSNRRPIDTIAGLDAGANDHVVKPFDPGELRARVSSGARLIELQTNFAAKVNELEAALASVRRLSGLLPICAYCKAIRDDSDYWHRVEEYVCEHADVKFSHGICPSCLEGALQQARNVRREVGTSG